jgi:hypothetical protein
MPNVKTLGNNVSLLDRGFKAWAERFGEGLRKELGISSTAPLDPRTVANFLGIGLCTPLNIPGLSREAIDQLLVIDPSGWSAITVMAQQRPIVIYNPAHSPARRASDLAHELAHIILEHDPAKMVLSQDGEIVMRSFNEKQEEEANWLAASLLLPREALLKMVRSGQTISEIAQQYGVSEKLASYRVQITGVRTQIRRYARG